VTVENGFDVVDGNNKVGWQHTDRAVYISDRCKASGGYRGGPGGHGPPTSPCPVGGKLLPPPTRCQILRLKCTKFDFGWGSAPDPAYRSVFLTFYSVSQKSCLPKTFCNILTQVKYISVKFCQYITSLYLHIFTNFGRFMLIFDKMALIFLGVPTVFDVFSFKFHQVKST